MSAKVSCEYKGWGPTDHANADLKVIGSHNQWLWVSSRQLSRYSSVFSSMISTCNDPFKSVRLTDPDNETASHLEAILEIIAALDGNNGTLQSILARFMNEQVVILAEKYDMTLIILTIRSYLFGLAIQYPPAGGGYCLVAAHMSEWTLCGRLVASLGAPNQSPRGVLMRRMLDWRGWTPEIMATLGKVDSKFVRAVCQAGTKHAGEKNGVEFIEYQGMGRDLAWLMNATLKQAEERVERWRALPSWTSLSPGV